LKASKEALSKGMFRIFKKATSKIEGENYKIGEDYVEARIDVKDFDAFIEKFKKFLDSPEVKSTFRCRELLIQSDEIDKILVRVDREEGIGFVENLKISCGDAFVGLILVKYIDRKLFLLSPALKRKIPLDEVKYLKFQWKAPIERVTVFVKPDDLEEFCELFKGFLEKYRDSYPNPLAARYAPIVKEIE